MYNQYIFSQTPFTPVAYGQENKNSPPHQKAQKRGSLLKTLEDMLSHTEGSVESALKAVGITGVDGGDILILLILLLLLLEGEDSLELFIGLGLLLLMGWGEEKEFKLF